MAEMLREPDTAAAVLEAVRAETAVGNTAETRRLKLAVDWAAMHSTDSLTDAATHWWHGVDTGMTIAGDGAPLITEFAVAEFAATIGMSTEAGKTYLGEAVELRYRLPRLWARIVSGDLPPGGVGRSPGRPCSCHRTRPRSWTSTCAGSPTGSAPAWWTG